jgi:cysteine-rich repeat protein
MYRAALISALLELGALAGCSERALPITGPPNDLATSPDLSAPPDLATPPASDLAVARDLSAFYDLGTPPDLAVRSDLSVRVDLAVPPDLAAPADLAAVCGNGRRDGLEGCDDGNRVSGDGCRADCVIEGAKLPIFKDLHGTGIGVYSIAATPSGQIYLGDLGTTSKVDRMAPNGTITKNVVPGVPYWFDMVAVNEDLVIGGQDGSGLSMILGWSSKSNTTTTLYSERRTYGVYSVAAVDLGLTKTLYSDNSSNLRRAVSATTSTAYGSYAGSALEAQKLASRPNGTTAIMLLNQLYADDGAGNFSRLYQFTPNGTEYWSYLTADGESTVYLSCIKFVSYTGAGGCDSGALWAVDATGSDARPFIDNFAELDDLTWDPSSNQLVIVVGTLVLEPKLVRVSLAR